jgi:hypothetical protein
MLVAVEMVGKGDDGAVRWRCLCDCGRYTVIRGYEMKRQRSCGCERPGQRAQCEGIQAGTWTVLRCVGSERKRCGRSKWLAVCKCGRQEVLKQREWEYRWSCGCTRAPANIRAANAVRSREYYWSTAERRRTLASQYYHAKRNRSVPDDVYASRGSGELRSEWEARLASEGLPRELLRGAREVPTEPAVLDDAFNRFRG